MFTYYIYKMIIFIFLFIDIQKYQNLYIYGNVTNLLFASPPIIVLPIAAISVIF